MTKYLSLFLFATASIYAAIHPDFKLAIDNNDIAKALKLKNNFGIKDIYCPSSLSYEKGIKLYGDDFRKKPSLVYQFCDNDFIENLEKKACTNKDNLPLCKEALQQALSKDFINFKAKWVTLLKDVKKHKLHQSQKINPFSSELNFLAKSLNRSLTQVNFSAQDQDLFELYKQLDTRTPSYDVITLPKENDLIEEIKSEYSLNSSIKYSTLLKACRIDSKINVQFEKKLGLSLFSCKDVFKIFEEKCENRKISKQIPITTALSDFETYLCYGDYSEWRKTSSKLELTVFPHVCSDSILGKVISGKEESFICKKNEKSTLEKDDNEKFSQLINMNLFSKMNDTGFIWSKASKIDLITAPSTCHSGNVGSTTEGSDKNLYLCENYTQNEYQWRIMSDIEVQTYPNKCSFENDYQMIRGKDEKLYLCAIENGTPQWRRPKKVEAATYPERCYNNTQKKMTTGIDRNKYVCDEGASMWRNPTWDELDSCTSTSTGKYHQEDSTLYVCRNSPEVKWEKATAVEKQFYPHKCNARTSGKFYKDENDDTKGFLCFNNHVYPTKKVEKTKLENPHYYKVEALDGAQRTRIWQRNDPKTKYLIVTMEHLTNNGKSPDEMSYEKAKSACPYGWRLLKTVEYNLIKSFSFTFLSWLEGGHYLLFSDLDDSSRPAEYSYGSSRGFHSYGPSPTSEYVHCVMDNP